jgi:hypothetical protein
MIQELPLVSGTLNVCIKDYVLASAAGALGPTVFIIADDSLRADDIRTKSVGGLSHDADPLKVGWIVFLKTRTATQKFYKFYLDTILIPHITSIRTSLNLKEAPAFFSVDGEVKCINTWMEPECVQKFDDANIMLAKHSASYSEGTLLMPVTLSKASKVVRDMLRRPPSSLSPRTCVVSLTNILPRI